MNNRNNTTLYLSSEPRAFSMITKVPGSVCNLNCAYCYYLEKENLYEKTSKYSMPEDILESFTKQYIEAQPDNTVVQFLWHGGEPTLLGVDYFKKALQFQKKYANGKKIENSLQTNGTLINEDWCRFFHNNNFLIGISIDGPEELHDQFRKTRGNAPTFNKVMHAIEMFRRYGVEFNTLSVVNKYNAEYPVEIYRFLKSIGSTYMQFLPVVERVSNDKQENGLELVPNSYMENSTVMDWSVEPLQYGKFMSKIFDEWVKKDVGRYYVQLFDVTLANWLNVPSGLCMFNKTCGGAGVIERNGDVYSCDHFVFPEYKIGNIQDNSLKNLMNNPIQQLFGQNKYLRLPKMCRECEHLNKCWGECPKKRFLKTPDGEYGLNYLCEGYKYFFSHVTPAMGFMANEILNKRPPSNVMNHSSSK
jgi:anaerobic sulfatase-maturating enzyme